MVNLEKILPTDDNETYVAHLYRIVFFWLILTFVIGIIFAIMTF